jgi:hypothetical protein
MKNITGPIGNRTRHFSDFSAVPQLTAPERSPSFVLSTTDLKIILLLVVVVVVSFRRTNLLLLFHPEEEGIADFRNVSNFTQLHGVTSQETLILRNASMRTSKLPDFCAEEGGGNRRLRGLIISYFLPPIIRMVE